jgi:hypothetical protein
MRSVLGFLVALTLIACSPDNAKNSLPIVFAGAGGYTAGSAGTSVSPPTGFAGVGAAGTGTIVPPRAGTGAGFAGAGPTGIAGNSMLPGVAGIGAAGRGVAGAPAAGSGAAGGGMPIAGAAAPTGGSGSVMTAKDPKLPAVSGACPPLKEGTSTMDFMGLKGVIFEVGPKQSGTGSLIFYWHGTGSFAGEYASSTIQAPILADLKAKGGILVSPQSGTGSGGDCSGTATFAMDDFKTADQIAACAVKDWNIDPHRIWSSGCSAGGLQAGCMAQMRSSYLAGAVPNSGGEVFPIAAQDPSHIGSMLTIHGAPGSDVVIVDFSDTSATIDNAIKMAGGFAVDCNHGGGHCGLPALPPEVAAAGWEFMNAHPFGVKPEPYASGLPADFPKYCKIW